MVKRKRPISELPVLLKRGLKNTLNVLRLSAVARDLRSRGKYFFDTDTRLRNSRFRRSNAPDGLPMPSPDLIYLVTNQFDAEAFYQNGVIGAECIEQVLKKHGLDINQFGKVLDFGCGCGRVIRQWKKLTGPKLFGVDYNYRPIRWCQHNLSFAEFTVNKLGTPLSFLDGTVDFIYSISVFTHLTELNQRFWMDELTRVLKPGGYLLFTVHGTTRVEQLTFDQRRAFASGDLVVVGGQYSGTNSCGTYHPLPYVQKVLCSCLHLVAFEPGAAKDVNQDVFLVQKPV